MISHETYLAPVYRLSDPPHQGLQLAALCCPVGKASGVGVGTKAAARWIISRTGWPSIGALAYIHKRRQAGHWEGDLMLFAKYGQAVFVVAHDEDALAGSW